MSDAHWYWVLDARMFVLPLWGYQELDAPCVSERCTDLTIDAVATLHSHFRLMCSFCVAYGRPFGRTCGTPRQNAKLYPVVMAEMARVLRPGSGRAVLLVAQPHLLGVPGIQRDNRKDRKKLLKKHARVGHHSGGAEAKAASEHERFEQGGRGKAIPPQAASNGGSRASGSGTSDTANHGQRGAGGGEKKKEMVLDVEPRQQDERSVAAKAEAWRIRARHAVNVGGLISYLLVLDRTNEPSPLRCSDRRNHAVGVSSLCKRRNENQLEGSSGSS